MIIGRGNRNTRRNPAEIFMRNPTCPYLGSKVGRSSASLSYGTVCDKARKWQILMGTPWTWILFISNKFVIGAFCKNKKCK
jgi:hypothetical protein